MVRSMRNASIRVIPLIVVLLFGVQSAAAQSKSSRCFPYEPDTVRVSGTLARHTYYGAPGFGEDPKHDAKEVGFYLDLPTPICTTAGGDDFDIARTGIRRVQLILHEGGYARLRPLLGKRVTLRGTLIGSITRHHHAPVLLDVMILDHREIVIESQ